MPDINNNGNGFITKQYLELIKDGQQDMKQSLQNINKRIDDLHEKVNSKMSRAELGGWLVAVSALVVLIQAVM